MTSETSAYFSYSVDQKFVNKLDVVTMVSDEPAITL